MALEVFDVVISDVYSPKGVRTVQVPIWSEDDGQDDIRWYEATRQTDGNYKVTVQVANHKKRNWSLQCSSLLYPKRMVHKSVWEAHKQCYFVRT